MVAKENKSKKPTILIIILAIILYIIFVFWRQSTMKPIIISDSSTIYYRDIFGEIYYDSLTGCLDICFLTFYSSVRGADKNSFTVLLVKSGTPYQGLIESGYAKDKFNVYINGRVLSGADEVTFKALRSNLGKDFKQYYYYNSPLTEFIKKEFRTPVEFDPGKLKVISYGSYEYEDLIEYTTLILEQDSRYYKVKFDTPLEFEEISSEEARTYPPLKAD